MPIPARRGAHFALGLSGLVCLSHAPGAYALDQDKVLLRANASVNYDSNVFRFSDQIAVPPSLGGPGKSDIYYGLGAGARLHLPVSRQVFSADVSATQYSYSTFDVLNYTGYNGRATWDWRAGNDWYGQLTAGARQARQAISTEVGFFVPRLYKTYDQLATLRYGLTPRWELQGGFSAYQTRYSDPVARGGDFDAQTWDLGAKYTSPVGNSTGLRLRYEHGEWINLLPGSNPTFGTSYDQYTASAVVDWYVTGHSRLYGDVGYTERQRQQASEGDFSGLSGRLNYDLTLSGKLLLHTSLYQIRGPFDSAIANYTRQTGVDLTGTYDATGKTSVQGLLTYLVLDFLGTALPGALPPNGEQRQDKLTYYGINVAHRPTRTVTLSAGVGEQTRTSNVPFGDFKATMAYLSAQIEF